MTEELLATERRARAIDGFSNLGGGGAGNSLLSISVLFLNHQIMSGGRGVKPPSAPFLTRPLQAHPIRKKEEKNKEKNEKANREIMTAEP